MKDKQPKNDQTLTVHIPMRLDRRGGRKLVIAPYGATPLPDTPTRNGTKINAIVKAHCWRRRIESGQAKSITDLAAQEGVTDAYVCRLLPLTCLAATIVAAILDGRQPQLLSLTRLLSNISLQWEEQPRP